MAGIKNLISKTIYHITIGILKSHIVKYKTIHLHHLFIDVNTQPNILWWAKFHKKIWTIDIQMAYDWLHFTQNNWTVYNTSFMKLILYIILPFRFFVQTQHGIHRVKKRAKKNFHQKTGRNRKMLYLHRWNQYTHYQVIISCYSWFP